MSRALLLAGLSAVLAIAGPVRSQVPTGPLIGTVHAPDGTPASGATVRVLRGEGATFVCLDLDLAQTWIEVARVQTGRNGRFGLHVPLGLGLRVEVDAPPHAFWVSHTVLPGEELTVRLEPGATLQGRLLDRAKGAPRTGRLRGWDETGRVQWFDGRTDAEGRYRFDRLPSGTVRIDVAPDTAVTPPWTDKELAAGGVLTLDFALDDGVVTNGVVTDAVTGRPIAGATLGEGWVQRKAVRTDVLGQYRIVGTGDPGRPDLHCRAPGYVWQHVVRDGPANGPRREDFALRPGIRVVGRVVDASGRAIAGAYVAAITSHDNMVPWLPARTDADGTFTIGGLPPQTQAVLLVRSFGHASVVSALPASTDEIDAAEVRLPAPRVVQGVVAAADGTPAAGLEVSLRGFQAGATDLAPLPASWPFLHCYVAQRTVRTDALGRFAFGDVAPGSYAVTPSGFGQFERNSIEVEIGETGSPPLLHIRP